MATKKQGTLATAGEWWRHLKPLGKRQVWKKERRLGKHFIKEQLDNDSNSR